MTPTPRANPEAHLIHRVTALTEEIRRHGRRRGAAGAARAAWRRSSRRRDRDGRRRDMVITNGARMEELYGIVEGRDIGTRFVAR